MASSYKRVCGLDWPINTPDHVPYLTIARLGWSPRAMKRLVGEAKTAKQLGLPDPGECMVEGVRRLLTPQEFSINHWSEQILISLTNNEETTLAGAASCGKSFVTGLWALLWWSMCPRTTVCFMGSTSVSALRRRTFIGCIRYHTLLKKRGGIGVFSRSLCAIVNEDENRDGITADDVSSGILGIAFFGSSSPETQATRIGGTHMSTIPGSPDDGSGSVVVILDEMQALPSEAISRALVNLASGTDLVRVCGSGNFNTRTDMLGERAEPATGWASVTLDDKTWPTTRGGVLIRLDAYDSPAVIEPDGEEKYPFLVGPKHIQRMLKEVKGNELDPKFLSMARAWPRLEDDIAVVFPVTLQAKHKVRRVAEWMNPLEPRQRVMALDPAYTAGGDQAAVCIMEVGVFSDGVLGMSVAYLDSLRIDAKSSTPVQYQIAEQIIRLAAEWHIPMTHFGVDSSANQLIADVIARESGQEGIVRINFAGRATDNPISVFSTTPAKDKFANLISELWFRVVEYASFGQLRNLPAEPSRQFASRKIDPNRTPTRLIKKSEYKKECGRSPDEADVVAMAAHLVQTVLRISPGATARHSRYMRNPAQMPRQIVSADYLATDFSAQESY